MSHVHDAMSEQAAWSVSSFSALLWFIYLQTSTSVRLCLVWWKPALFHSGYQNLISFTWVPETARLALVVWRKVRAESQWLCAVGSARKHHVRSEHQEMNG